MSSLLVTFYLVQKSLLFMLMFFCRKCFTWKNKQFVDVLSSCCRQGCQICHPNQAPNGKNLGSVSVHFGSALSRFSPITHSTFVCLCCIVKNSQPLSVSIQPTVLSSTATGRKLLCVSMVSSLLLLNLFGGAEFVVCVYLGE